MYSHDLIHDTLRECAQICILPYFKNLKEGQIATKAHAHDFVTIADREAEKFLTEKLTALIPGSMVLGEESFAEDCDLIERVRTVEHVWILDPVDGTSNFKNGKDEFCTILAHAHRGKLVGAWIYVPRSGMFAAWQQGDDVLLDGEKVILDTSPKPLRDMVATECFSYNCPELKTVFGENFKVFGKSYGSSCYGVDTLRMLQGKLDANSFGAGNPWDISACVAMVNALGGKAQKLNGAAIEGAELFTTEGSFLATISPTQWEDVRDAMLRNIDGERFGV